MRQLNELNIKYFQFVLITQMASIQTECFNIGSTVAVTTCYDESIEGQVMAFDLNTKLLILSE